MFKDNLRLKPSAGFYAPLLLSVVIYYFVKFFVVVQRRWLFSPLLPGTRTRLLPTISAYSEHCSVYLLHQYSCAIRLPRHLRHYPDIRHLCAGGEVCGVSSCGLLVLHSCSSVVSGSQFAVLLLLLALVPCPAKPCPLHLTFNISHFLRLLLSLVRRYICNALLHHGRWSIGRSAWQQSGGLETTGWSQYPLLGRRPGLEQAGGTLVKHYQPGLHGFYWSGKIFVSVKKIWCSSNPIHWCWSITRGFNLRIAGSGRISGALRLFYATRVWAWEENRVKKMETVHLIKCWWSCRLKKIIISINGTGMLNMAGSPAGGSGRTATDGRQFFPVWQTGHCIIARQS